MLNGKFFTGLPPKMIDRGTARGRNRLESHLFWPDDTQVDTAVESHIKRRNSMQLACQEKPLYEKQNSVVASDVDTKKRFTKEFSQSSIQFYDNLSDNYGHGRKPQLRNSAANRQIEITEKPTNTKLELPDSSVNDAYTAAKKKQAYTSKIEFYDYVNDREGPQQNNRNKLPKPKMDMNDKREMELNLKNSPKLQMKRDVRSLSEEKEQAKINNREVRAMEKPVRPNINDIYDQRERFARNEENYLRSRRSVPPRGNVSPNRGLSKSIYREQEPLAYERRKPTYYDNFEERENANVRFSPRDCENLDDTSSYRQKREVPERMIRNNTREYNNLPDDRDYSQKYQVDVELKNRMRNLDLRSPPPRKQFYTPEEYYDDEPQHYYDRNDQVTTPTDRGNFHQRYNNSDNETDMPYKNWNNATKSFNTDHVSFNKINNQIQQKPVASPTSPSPSEAETLSSTKSQAHLRSSLCFNNGEIIGANEATTSSSPTSSQYPTQRRNARSSATQRVSVGLPD